MVPWTSRLLARPELMVALSKTKKLLWCHHYQKQSFSNLHLQSTPLVVPRKPDFNSVKTTSYEFRLVKFGSGSVGDWSQTKNNLHVREYCSRPWAASSLSSTLAIAAPPHRLPSLSIAHPHHCRMSSSSSAVRGATIDHHHQEEEQDEAMTSSNRAAFKATPIIPSILAHIEKIGVGIRSKPKRHKKSRSTRSSQHQQHRGGDTLDEIEEFKYFNDNERRHRTQWHNKRGDDLATRGGGGGGRYNNNSNHSNNDREEWKDRGAYWLPPPPFSSFAKVVGENGTQYDDESSSSLLQGQRIIRRPVKLLGTAGSLTNDNNNIPRESKGLSEVAIAGRSNVGKSTLLNALLYGNTDENLSPRQYQRGRTPENTKLPRGIKAETSSKPGQTKELSFYQLTADVVMTRQQQANGMSDDEDDFSTTKTMTKKEKQKKKKDLAKKMSLLLVDLPGYGFAFAKMERTKEWKDLMHYYLLERSSLKRILLLLDARHGFKKADFDFLGELQDGLMMAKAEDTTMDGKKKAKRDLPPIQIVLTKCDLVKQADLARRVVIVRKQLSDFLIREPSSLPVMLVSARAGLGFNNIRRETPLGGVLELQRELASLVPMPRAHGRKT
ncbi:hypothetical protein ACHAXR_009723 [Thalassiosira sp. AJA248-18]